MTMHCLRCHIQIHDDAPHYNIEVLGFDYKLPIKIIKSHEPIPPAPPKATLTRTSGIIHHCVKCFEEHEKLLAAHTYWALGEDVQEITDD